MFIWPYKIGSEGAKALAEKLGLLRIKGDKWTSRAVINWGNSETNPNIRGLIINHPNDVKKASNKISALTIMKAAGVPTVEFTTDPNVAMSWHSNEEVVYARTLVNSYGGRGIKVLTLDEDFIQAPLYTKAVLKAREYRVHITRRGVLDFTQKKRRQGLDSTSYIKNSDNGWVYCRDEVFLPAPVLIAAYKALASLQLDFGAIDIMFKDDKAYVLEVNTAPGIEGKTLEAYTKFFTTFKERKTL